MAGEEVPFAERRPENLRLNVTLAVGTRLGSYEVLAPPGAGGMGEVYRAKNPRFGREVANPCRVEGVK